MPHWAARLLANERDLRMVWKLEKGGRRSVLVGTAHFFPYRFRSALRPLIRDADAILSEGPLDEAAQRKVVAAGSVRRGASLVDALDVEAVRRVQAVLGALSERTTAGAFYWSVLRDGEPASIIGELRQLEPWMAFFHIWTEYRRRDGWIYSMDLDAAGLATALGKEAHPLETIEEQIATLGRVPLERFVAFLEKVDWEQYRRDYVRHYLAGNLAALLSVARAFPTFCAPVIDERAPVLCERMSPFLERGNILALVGILHCPGLIPLLRARGYAVSGPAAP